MSQPRLVEESLYSLATRLGALRDKVVFSGSAIRDLLIDKPDTASDVGPPRRSVHSFVVIVSATAELIDEVSKTLESTGFVRSTPHADADTSRASFVDRDTCLSVITTTANGPSEARTWHEHAYSSADTFTIAMPGHPALGIRVVSPAAFLALALGDLRKPAATGGAVSADEMHSRLGDIVAVIDGRVSLLDDIAHEGLGLRSFVGGELTECFSTSPEEQVTELAVHLGSAPSRRSSLAMTATRLRRLQRCGALLSLNETRRSSRGGGPGATGQSEGPWTYVIRGYETVSVQRHKPKGVFVAVAARLKSHGRSSGKAGDGRDVCIEDNQGVLHPPNYSATVELRQNRRLLGPYDTVRSEDPYETLWVYDLPRNAAPYRVILPFDGVELALHLDAT